MSVNISAISNTILVEKVSKYFGQIAALSQIGFVMRNGELVALAGGNGSGKSTLLKVISGVLTPDSGQVTIGGHVIRGGDVRDARAHGIQMVFQDGALCPDANVLENMFLGCEVTTRMGFLRMAQMKKHATALIEKYQLPLVNTDGIVRDLSGGQRKAVAIARALLSQPRLLLLDEPTAALGVKEQHILLGTIRELNAKGVGIIICTHSPEEILSVASRVLILRRGTLVADEPVTGLSKATLALQMSS